MNPTVFAMILKNQEIIIRALSTITLPKISKALVEAAETTNEFVETLVGKR